MQTPFSKLKINIALADDHRLVRQAFRKLLSSEQEFNFTFEAEDGVDLIEKLSENRPDILLLDIKMPKLNGIEVLKYAFENFPDVKILILSAFVDEVYVGESLHYGVYGYLTKSMDVEEIIKAIKTAYSNDVYITNLLSSQLYKNYLVTLKKKREDILPKFSIEEIKIVELLKAEKTTSEISEIMNLSKRTIELKRDKMREKSNSKTVGGLLLYAMKRGFIE